MTVSPETTAASLPDSATVSPETLRPCPCGKEMCRPGQRNGYACHRAANEAHRLRRQNERNAYLKEIHDLKLALIAKNVLKETRA